MPWQFDCERFAGLAAEKEELAKQSEVQQKKKVLARECSWNLQQPVAYSGVKACPLNCDSHGDCHDGTCICRDGWTGPACQDMSAFAALPTL